MYKWKKGENVKLGKYFSSFEFSCTCNYKSCVDQVASKDLIKKLDQVREKLGSPIIITSGFRCDRKQADLRKAGHQTATGKSSHEEGIAADIAAIKSKDLLKIVKETFDNIGTASTFLHVDVRPLKADGTKRLWKYA